MFHRNRWLVPFFALVAIATCCATSGFGSVHLTVGKYELDESPVPFVASWLHDASASASAGASVYGPGDNRAYRTGKTSSALSGSFEGDFDASGNILSNIRGTLSGTTKLLLNSFNSGNDFKNFVLKLGQQAGSGKDGKLAFETVGTREYTGGFIDYVLAVDVNDDNVFVDVLSGTFFFKPQAENSNSLLSPNRGTISAFMLWGYNYMHDSDAFGGGNASWTDLFALLGGYANDVTRPDIVDDPNGDQTLGISLYVTSDYTGNAGQNPEPTALIIWGMLAMIGACVCGRNR